jgi:hypothetical protein
MADVQAASKKNSGKNCSTSPLRKQHYASYKLKHGNKQHVHPVSSKRSPLVKISRHKQVVADYYKSYNTLVVQSNKLDTDMPALPWDPATVRMLRAHGVDRKHIIGLKA